MYHLYRVTADPETGEWLDSPTLIGIVDERKWLDKLATHPDTDEVHYDCIPDYDGGRDAAVEVHWTRT